MNQAPAKVGDRVEDIDTPALVLEMDAFERNLKTLADTVKGKPVRVRTHAKTHKCPEIAKRQLAHGAVGVCVDNAENLAALEASGAKLDVYIELEVGMRRCGIAPGPAAVEMARTISRSKNLRFAGLQAYHGRAQHMRTMEERHAAIEGAAQHVYEMKRLLAQAGIECPIVTGAGSGTYMLEVEAGAWDELQPGSYIFMDVDYAKNEWAAPLPRFEHALFVLATVMSRPAPDRAIVDAGLKASSVDSGLPQVWQWKGLTYRGASDEHGSIEIATGAQAPALGEKLYLVPGHCDPTVNLYDFYVCVRNGRVEALWPITARGALN